MADLVILGGFLGLMICMVFYERRYEIMGFCFSVLCTAIFICSAIALISWNCYGVYKLIGFLIGG